MDDQASGMQSKTLTPLLAKELLDGLARGQSVGSSKNAVEPSIVVNIWAGDGAASLPGEQGMTLQTNMMGGCKHITATCIQTSCTSSCATDLASGPPTSMNELLLVYGKGRLTPQD